jgi:hypothetical protein
VNLKSYLLRRRGRPTSPSSGQAPFNSLLRTPGSLPATQGQRYPDIVHLDSGETPMERLDKSQSHSFQPVRVQTKVIKEILVYLEGREGLEIIADDVRYESASELVQDRLSTRVKQLSLKARSPYGLSRSYAK